MSNTADHILKRATALLKSGDHDGARPLLAEAAAAGSVQAIIELAFICVDAGDIGGADCYMAQAVQLADDNADGVGHLACALAYQVGSGSCGLDESFERARAHFEKAAKLDVSTAQLLLAREHLMGLNGADVDRSKYDHWIARAIELGDDDALLEHVEHMLRLDEPISDGLRIRLSQNTTQPERTRKLVRSLDSRSARKPS